MPRALIVYHHLNYLSLFCWLAVCLIVFDVRMPVFLSHQWIPCVVMRVWRYSLDATVLLKCFAPTSVVVCIITSCHSAMKHAYYSKQSMQEREASLQAKQKFFTNKLQLKSQLIRWVLCRHSNCQRLASLFLETSLERHVWGNRSLVSREQTQVWQNKFISQNSYSPHGAN